MSERNQPTRRQREVERLGIFGLFVTAMGVGTVVDIEDVWILPVLGGIVGLMLATALELVWRERTRPKNKPIWWLLGLPLVGIILYATFMGFLAVSFVMLYVPVGLIVGLVSRHDLGMAPTLILGGIVLIAASPANWRPELVPPDGDATRIAIAVLLGVAAATWEHERLMRLRGAGTPAAWTTIRLAFVAIWTIAILALREQIQWGRVFTFFGADLRGQDGQMLLVGILLVALVVAAFAFQPGKRKA